MVELVDRPPVASASSRASFRRTRRSRDDVTLSKPEVPFRLNAMFTPAVARDGKRLGMRRDQDVPLEPFTLGLHWPQALR